MTINFGVVEPFKPILIIPLPSTFSKSIDRSTIFFSVATITLFLLSAGILVYKRSKIATAFQL
jgi:hypothetical protein